MGKRTVFCALEKRCLAAFATFVAVLSSAALCAPGSGAQLTEAEKQDGWISLFDGESLFGWDSESEVDWKVEDGAISATKGTIGLLHTRNQFGDFELKVEFKAAKGTNSGVFLRTSPVCGDAGPNGDCYELNIAPPDNPFPTGSLVMLEKYSGAGESDGWRQFDIRAEGAHIQVWLDGKPVMDFTDPSPLGRGHIGLQYNQGAVAFRNIRLKPLNLQPVFDGKSLDEWSVYPGKKSLFSVTEGGEINVKNGPGQIESRQQFGDFVLQLRVIANGEQLNSGIFFRSVPGEFWQGYESQVHNGFKNGDRSQPVDYGTGGIYRRQPARKVVPNDFEWFYKTIVATGDAISVWVNGYQVSCWTDTREPDANPRNGLRTEPGTVIIQGHDPTTDLSFGDIRAVELAARGRGK